MCGRFTLKSERPDIQLEFYIGGWNLEPSVSYNIAPSQKAGVIFKQDNKNIFDMFQWGLVPHWSNSDKNVYAMINAKAETITERPSFKALFKNKRCLIPANGFYEWKKEGNKKTPFYIFLKDNSLFSMAGLYDEWITPKNEKLLSFTIITTKANELVDEIHDKKRMPAIIKKEDRECWLDNSKYNEKKLVSFLIPHETNLMDAYEVSTLINSPKNNSPKCIERIR